MINSSSSSPTPSPSSSTHLCLMAKGERKVSNDDDSSGDEHASNDDSDSDDDEFESPSYDDLVKLLNQYTKIIRKSRAKNEKLELKNDSLLAKCDIAEKASVELREANDAMSSKLKELKSSKKELKDKHDKLDDMVGVDPDLLMRGWGNFDLGKDSTLVVRLQHLVGLLRLSNRYTNSDLLLFLPCQEQP